MAALQDPNPYELRPQPRPHAESGHTHQWRMTHEHLFDQRCIECNVSKAIADIRYRELLEKRIAKLESGIRRIRNTPPRAAGARTGGFAAIYEICDNLLPLSEWPPSRTDDEG